MRTDDTWQAAKFQEDRLLELGPLKTKRKIYQQNTELELKVCDSWITNQFLEPTNQKFVKLPFFMNCFFSKYDNLYIHIISVFLSV